MRNQDFGGRLRHARQLRGFTQTGLAAKIGLCQQAISNSEKGISEPSLANLRRLAKTLNVTSDYLLGLPHASAADKDVKDIINAPDDAVVLTGEREAEKGMMMTAWWKKTRAENDGT